jgi:hypothetical protein
LQHLRRVHVLPPALAYVDGPDFIIAGHQSNSIGKAAIILAAVGLRPLEMVEDFQRANEQASIDRIEFPQIFPDSGDVVFTRLDFHRIIQIEN